jgi:UDP-3-O-[3-hydroxymyristoyl] glucosamine N-acyltransferase
VLIKSGTIIGQKGFNFEYDETGTPIPFTHFGQVIIGDNVELGALNTLVQGTLSNTVISDYVKTDDHVHIAHNVEIGFGTLIAACAEISGSVKIGSRTWLAPNCSIMDHIAIGNNVIVGLGSVVTKSVPDNVVVAGSPARKIRDR